MEWPDDDFTFRRLRDGDVTLEGGGTHEAVPTAPAATEPKRYGGETV